MNNNLKANHILLFAQTALVAFFIDIPALNQIFVSFAPSLSGRLMTLMYFFCGIMLVILVIPTIIANHFVNKKLFLFIVFIAMGYFLTIIFAPYSDLSIANFGVYTLIALLMVLLCQVDGKLLIILIMMFPVFGIVNVNNVFATNSYQYETISMGMSYAFMPTVVSAIAYFYSYYKSETTKKKILLIPIFAVNIIYLLKIIQFGSRGVVLCFLCCFIFFNCFNYDSINMKVSFKGYKAFLILIVAVVVLMNIWTVFVIIENLIESAGFHINAINKFFRLANATGGDVSNGRNAIYEATINGIWQSPFWGHGYSTTMNNLGFVYPHNFLLQLLYDGGLLLTMPLIILVVGGVLNWYKFCSEDEFTVISALLLMSVPGALFSGNLWENNRLWLTFAALIAFSARSWIIYTKKE